MHASLPLLLALASGPLAARAPVPPGGLPAGVVPGPGGPPPPGMQGPGEPTTVRLGVSNLTGTEELTLRALARWGDEDLQIELTDDGSTPGDLPSDGIWVGVLTGPPVDAVHLRLVLERTAQPPVEVYAGLEDIRAPEDRLSWSLDLGLQSGEAPRATRISAPYIARRLDEVDARSAVASYGWLLVLGAWLSWLGEGWLRRRAARRTGTALERT